MGKDVTIIALCILLLFSLIHFASEPNEVGLAKAETASVQAKYDQAMLRLAAYPTPTPRACGYYYQNLGYGC